MVDLYGLSAYPITSAPQAYDIVSVAFPYQERPSKPGPKLRPGLVLSVSAHKDQKTGHNFSNIQIAYGTSSPIEGPPWDVFPVHNFVALQKSGLCTDTRFLLSRVQKLMWCEEFFPIIERFGTPIMGHLPHDKIVALQKIKEVRAELKSQGLA